MCRNADRTVSQGIWLAMVAALLCVPFGLGGSVQAAMWTTWSETSPASPTLDPGSIKLAARYDLHPGDTVVVIEGDSIELSAKSDDWDRLAYDPYPYDFQIDWREDECDVIWTKLGGTLSTARTRSGFPTTFTAPLVPQGQDSIELWVKGQADDDTTAPPGDPTWGHGGNRDDNPGTSVTITIKVIKACPTTINLASTCFYPTDFPAFWVASYPSVKTWGQLFSKMQVSGGPPPNPPNTWNGLVIKESLAPHPVDDGTAVDADFTGLTTAQICSGSSSFLVGQAGGGSAGNCSSAAADNAFWDFHQIPSPQNGTLVFNAGPSKTVICQQKYFCKNTQLTKDGTNPATFEITRTFTNSTYGGNRVVEVATSKATE